MQQNLQIINLYYNLAETQKLMQNTVLPVAGYLGMEKADPELFDAATRFCEALTSHLEDNKLQVCPVSNESQKDGKKYD